jgi:hypothetical protein
MIQEGQNYKSPTGKADHKSENDLVFRDRSGTIEASVFSSGKPNLVRAPWTFNGHHMRFRTAECDGRGLSVVLRRAENIGTAPKAGLATIRTADGRRQQRLPVRSPPAYGLSVTSSSQRSLRPRISTEVSSCRQAPPILAHLNYRSDPTFGVQTTLLFFAERKIDRNGRKLVDLGYALPLCSQVTEMK